MKFVSKLVILVCLLLSLPAAANIPDTSNIDAWRQSIEDRLGVLESAPPVTPPVEPPPITQPPIDPPDQGVIQLEAGTYSTPQTCPGGGQAILCGKSNTTIRPAPGARVVIDCSQVTGWDAGTGDLVNATVSGLEFDCGGTGRAMRASRRGTRTNLRIENNYVHDARSGNSGAFGEFSSTIDLFIIGNRIERTGVPGQNNAHAIYHGGRGTNRNVHIEGNRITNHVGGRAIQVYGHSAGETMTGLFIERNEVTDYAGNAAILVSRSDGPDKGWVKDATIRGNIVINGRGAAVDLRCPGAVVTLQDNLSEGTGGLNAREYADLIDLGGNVWQ